MPISTSAFAGLLPLVGAAALTMRGVARLRAKRDRPPREPPRPREVAPPDPAPARRPRKTLPDAVCEGCGTSIPGTDTLCPLCARKHHGGGRTKARTTLLHWLVLLGVMTAIFAAGALLAP